MEERAINIHVVSLGCDKNLVDSEAMLGLIRREGHAIVNDPAEAEAIVVNTCGFIGAAVREGVSEVLEMARYKAEGRCKALIVTGCMVERYKGDILSELPEVDAVLGANEWERVTEAIKAADGAERPPSADPLPSAGRQPFEGDIYANRVLSTHTGYAYLKIAEGCGNHCTYCTIPSIKGPYKSRPMESLLNEARNLAGQGVRELVLVAQDTTLYGTDISGRPMLDELLRGLSGVEGIEWLRVMYAYPENITEALICEISGNNKICKYLDMPIQHASDYILKSMGRKSTEKELRGLIGRLRGGIPGIALRTTLITGFPGETERDFEILMNFIEYARFDHLGVFEYSREEGTPAFSMPSQVPAKIKKSRRGRLMKRQAEISLELNEGFISQTLKTITEGRVPDEENPGGFIYCGRSYRDCPESDGLVFFDYGGELMSGDFVNVLVAHASEHDLYGGAEM